MTSEDQTTATPPPPGGWLAPLDRWMGLHPWHPRLAPFLLYVLLIPTVTWSREHVPVAYPVINILRAVVVLGLLWRYRARLPELTLRFDWRAVPVGVAVFAAWVWLGIATGNFSRVWDQGFAAYTHDVWDWALHPHLRANPYPDPTARSMFDDLGLVVGSISFALRLLVMAAVVPIFEELCMRSLMLRSFHSFRRTALGALQFIQDLPLIGEWFSETPLGERVSRHPPVFGPEFEKTPLGALSFFGVAASTGVFMVSHVPRDYPGTIFCGVAYCLPAALTRRKGLGPVIWAHGITNAMLWGYTLYTGDWQFL